MVDGSGNVDGMRQTSVRVTPIPLQRLVHAGGVSAGAREDVVDGRDRAPHRAHLGAPTGGAVLDHSPVVTTFGAKFVTGNQGLGHVVLPALDVDGLFEFYTEVLGFVSRGAFRVPTPPEFGPVRVRFLGTNERHHSLAICPAMTVRDPGLIHLMVEVDCLDTVGQALDRVNKAGFQLSSTLGRHTNDKMVSFYVRAPGDWDIEFGTDGLRVDENHYTAEEITADSYWGHAWVSDLPAAMRP